MAASDLIGSGTAAGLLAFCDYLTDCGMAPCSAVNPWKSAARQVFTRVEGTEDLDGVDVQALDVHEYLERFVSASRGEYKPDSLAAYKNRFGKAVEAYRGYLADPVTWRPRLRASSRRAADTNANGRTPAAPTTPGLTDYPFPLRSGQMAHLHLPSPLDPDDADRLTQFLRALVFERQQPHPRREPDAG